MQQSSMSESAKLFMRLAGIIGLLALTPAVSSCAHPRGDDSEPSASARPAATAADYRRYIRGNVHAFSSARVYDWNAPDPSHVVVWTSPAEAYLLTLSGACFGLENAHTIFLAAEDGTVRPGSAAVAIGAERCRIQFVDRLDARAMKADGVH